MSYQYNLLFINLIYYVIIINNLKFTAGHKPLSNYGISVEKK